MSRTCLLPIVLWSAVAAAAGKDADLAATPLAGPFASIDAYCKIAPTRTLNDDSGWICVPKPQTRSDSGQEVGCISPDFDPLPDGVLTETRMIELRATGRMRPLCLLAWRTAAGWYIDESILLPTDWIDDDGGVSHFRRSFDVVVAARATAAPTRRGVVGRVRARRFILAPDPRGKDVDHLECYDTLELYGVGPSGALSAVSHYVGDHSACDAMVEQDQKLPPSRWNQYWIDELLPDGRLRLRQVGRHPRHGAPRLSEHTLRFP